MRDLKNIIIILILFSPADTALGVSEVTLNNAQRPHGAILFIVDGLGSSYYYPEFTPYALDGSALSKAVTSNLTYGTRILNMKTPVPVTGIAHSVIVTGYSQANEEIVGYPDATIYDITREHGFINLAVMEKGDFQNMREEQDIILFAKNNSIDEPVISIQAKKAPAGIYEVMYDWKTQLPLYLANKSGRGKYSPYNKWGIDAAGAVAEAMIKNYPSQRFLLTVNVGAIDSGGHNMGEDDYYKLIEEFDSDFYPIYKIASENNLALFFAADHGMSFAVKNARRGGHSSEKYAARQESVRIPLAVLSPNANPRVIKGEYGQEDIAPTLLSVLDLPNYLQYADGKTINIKNYASIFIKADAKYSISLWNDNRKISEGRDSELILSGLPLNASYTLKAASEDRKFEERISLDSDRQFILNSSKEMNYREILAVFLILVVIVAGLIVIKRIKD